MASSVYAVTKITSSSALSSKTLWIVIFIIGLTGSLHKSWRFFSFYFTYPTVVNLKVKQEKSLEFPAVTFCNLNRMLQFVRILHAEYGTPLVMSERRSLFSCKDGRFTSNEKDDGLIRDLRNYYQMNAEERFDKGSKPDELVKKCVFGNKLCSQNDTQLFQNFRYGNCFTFNKHKKDTPPLKIAKTGPGTGLVLDLSVNYQRYWQYTPTVGVRVVIHDPNAMPNPEDEGFNASPGYETLVSLKQTVYRRLPAPFKDKCVNYQAKKMSSVSNKNECIRTCIQMHNYAKCRCIDQTLAVKKQLMPCDMLNDTEMCCLNEVLDNLTNIRPICDCPQPCVSVQYNEVLSKALWLKEENTSKYNRSDLRLNVFYSSLEKFIYEQKPMFQESELFSYLGGELGLWLGLSLFALFEIVEKMPLITKLPY